MNTSFSKYVKQCKWGPRSGHSWFRLRRSPTGETPHNNLGASARTKCAEPGPALEAIGGQAQGAGCGGAVDPLLPTLEGRPGTPGVEAEEAGEGPRLAAWDPFLGILVPLPPFRGTVP